MTESRYRWVIVAAGGLLGCVAVGSMFSLPVLLQPIARDTGWSVHVPRDAKEMALRVDRASREMTDRLGRSPQVDELAEFLGISVEVVLGALEVVNAHFGTSLDAPAAGSDAEAAPLVEVLGSEDDRLVLADAALDLVAASGPLMAQLVTYG